MQQRVTRLPELWRERSSYSFLFLLRKERGLVSEVELWCNRRTSGEPMEVGRVEEVTDDNTTNAPPRALDAPVPRWGFRRRDRCCRAARSKLVVRAAGVAAS